jgi:hypothetical protein
LVSKSNADLACSSSPLTISNAPLSPSPPPATSAYVCESPASGSDVENSPTVEPGELGAWFSSMLESERLRAVGRRLTVTVRETTLLESSPSSVSNAIVRAPESAAASGMNSTERSALW